MGHHEAPRIPLFTAIGTYFGYALLMLVGHVRDFISKLERVYKPRKSSTQSINAGYAPIVSDFEDFYTRRLYDRINDCWNRPIASNPGAYIDVLSRTAHIYGQQLKLTGEKTHCLNLGSYNYLGFGDPDSHTKADVLKTLVNHPVSTCSQRSVTGTTDLHVQCEALVARYVGKPAAMVFGMGYGTNSTTLPALLSKGSLIISDAFNHASIAIGARSTGATIKVFRHNDVAHLEQVIRRAIVDGQPRSHRPWDKIMIIVEGIYSMEGEFCPLREIVEIKNKYRCYLYVDEAHSIGAIGQTGRGICEHSGVDPKEVDIMMGTFTKSFGSVGGYIAASQDIIDLLRHSCAGHVYSPSISPAACQQVISAMTCIMGEDGTTIGATKLKSLRDNANYFRKRLIEMGCHVLGDYDSPVVPTMLYNPAKIPAFSRECLKRGLAVVVVGFPACPLLLSRTRLCLSAAHTRKDLDWALEKIEEVTDHCGLRYAKSMF